MYVVLFILLKTLFKLKTGNFVQFSSEICTLSESERAPYVPKVILRHNMKPRGFSIFLYTICHRQLMYLVHVTIVFYLNCILMFSLFILYQEPFVFFNGDNPHY